MDFLFIVIRTKAAYVGRVVTKVCKLNQIFTSPPTDTLSSPAALPIPTSCPKHWPPCCSLIWFNKQECVKMPLEAHLGSLGQWFSWDHPGSGRRGCPPNWVPHGADGFPGRRGYTFSWKPRSWNNFYKQLAPHTPLAWLWAVFIPPLRRSLSQRVEFFYWSTNQCVSNPSIPHHRMKER